MSKKFLKKFIGILLMLVVLVTTINIPTVTKAGSLFPDVDDSQSYAKPVAWAVENGIVKGYKNGNFGPDDSCTREQFVVMIWRYNGKPYAPMTKDFSDVYSDKHAYRAIAWAVEEGIIVGYDDGTFRPENTVTRQQVAVMLWRMAGKLSADKSVKFSDVNTSMSGYRAIQWGSEAGLIKGYSDGTFRPTDDCLRKHIVTFLYRFDRDVKGASVPVHISIPPYYKWLAGDAPEARARHDGYMDSLYNAVIEAGVYEGEDEYSAYCKIRDYILKNVTYTKSEWYSNWLNCLYDGQGNSGAYTLLLGAMCAACHIRCGCIGGYDNGRFNAWNKIRLNNTWYYTDLGRVAKENNWKYDLSKEQWNGYEINNTQWNIDNDGNLLFTIANAWHV